MVAPCCPECRCCHRGPCASPRETFVADLPEVDGVLRLQIEGETHEFSVTEGSFKYERPLGEPPKVDESMEADPADPVTQNPRRHSWKEFQDSGLLWLINRTLHLHGWAIVISEDTDTGEFVDAYPVRCNWRGFPAENDARGFARVSDWMDRAGQALKAESTITPAEFIQTIEDQHAEEFGATEREGIAGSITVVSDPGVSG